MLKYTNAKLELVSDATTHQFIERSVRGGISMIVKRYAIANNPYLSDHNPTKPTSYILYLDKNNLYGYAMSQPLPTKLLDPLTEEEISKIDPNNLIPGFDEVDLVNFHVLQSISEKEIQSILSRVRLIKKVISYITNC